MKMKLTQHQERVLELMPYGKQNAIKIKDLIDWTGYSRREIKYLIRDLRKEYPICSGNEGYWLGDINDMKRCISNFTIQLMTKDKVIARMEKVLRGMKQ